MQHSGVNSVFVSSLVILTSFTGGRGSRSPAEKMFQTAADFLD